MSVAPAKVEHVEGQDNPPQYTPSSVPQPTYTSNAPQTTYTSSVPQTTAGPGIWTVQPVPGTEQHVVMMAAPDPHVQTHMVMSCLTCFFVNALFGCIAWIFACVSHSAQTNRDYNAARRWGQVAFWLCVIGWIMTGSLVLMLIIILAT